jgi:hypothetical protein
MDRERDHLTMRKAARHRCLLRDADQAKEDLCNRLASETQGQT